MLKIFGLIFSLFFSLSSWSNDVLIQAGHVFDPQSGLWKHQQTLLLRAGKIVAINPKNVKFKTMLDFKNAYVIPGLIDAHTHLFLEDPTYGKNFSQGLLTFLKTNTDKIRFFLAQKRSTSLLKSGFVAVRDLGNDGRTKIFPSGVRFFSSGPGFVPKLGQFPKGTSEKILFKEYSPMNSHELKKLARGKQKILKLYADEDPNPAVCPLPVLKEWIKSGHKLGMKVAVHAVTSEAIQNALVAGADSIEHGTELTEVQITQMNIQKTFWVPSLGTRSLMAPQFKNVRSDHIPDELALLCRKIEKAHKAGVTIVFGSDNYYSLEQYGIDFGQSTLEGLMYLNQCGLSNAEVLKSATMHAATLLNDSSLGNLTIGSNADFVVYKADPLKDISVLRRPFKVFKDGKEAL